MVSAQGTFQVPVSRDTVTDYDLNEIKQSMFH